MQGYESLSLTSIEYTCQLSFNHRLQEAVMNCHAPYRHALKARQRKDINYTLSPEAHDCYAYPLFTLNQEVTCQYRRNT